MRRSLLLSLLALAAVPAIAWATIGSIAQKDPPAGCTVPTGSSILLGCGTARTAKSTQLVVSPDGKQVYTVFGQFSEGFLGIWERDTASGAISERAGTGGCFTGAGPTGCAAANGLVSPQDVAIAPDGKQLFVADREADALLVFDRNTTTGALTQVLCVKNVGDVGCTDGRGLEGASGVAVSPDGTNVYVHGNGRMAIFDRVVASGAITQKSAAAGCFDTADGCTAGSAGIASEGRLAFSPGGSHLYVASYFPGGAAWFTRGAGGALTYGGCINADGSSGCVNGPDTIGQSVGIAASPDGTAVHLASPPDGSVHTLARNSSTGALSGGTCVSNAALGTCVDSRALNGATGLATMPDGTVYVAAGSSVSVFDQVSGPGLLQRAGTEGCVSDSGDGCRAGRQLEGTKGIAVAPDPAHHLYAGGFYVMAVFDRETPGRPLPAATVQATPSPTAGTTPVPTVAPTVMPTATPQPFRFRVLTGSLSVKRKRAIALPVDSTGGRLTLAVTTTRSPKVLFLLRNATLKAGKVTVRWKPRKGSRWIKPGRYRIAVTFRAPDGRGSKTYVKLRVR